MKTLVVSGQDEFANKVFNQIKNVADQLSIECKHVSYFKKTPSYGINLAATYNLPSKLTAIKDIITHYELFKNTWEYSINMPFLKRIYWSYSSIRNIKLAEVIINKEKPNRILVWNGSVNMNGAWVVAAQQHNIPCYYLEKSFFHNSWIIDKKGIGPLSSINTIEWKNEIETLDNTQKNNNIILAKTRISKSILEKSSAWEQPENNTELDQLIQLKKKGKKLLFFPQQVDGDTNIFLFSTLFKKCFGYLDFIVDNLQEPWNLVVKPHPKSLNPFSKNMYPFKKNNVHLYENINVHNIIEICDKVITINSNVGTESIMHNKPTATMGKYILDSINITKKVSDKKQLKDFLKNDNDTDTHYLHNAIGHLLNTQISIINEPLFKSNILNKIISNKHDL